MDFKKIGVNTRNWVDSTQDVDYWTVLLNAALNLRVSQAMELVMIPNILLCYIFICVFNGMPASFAE